MARYFDVNPQNPQSRALDQTAAILRDGGVIAYPTDSGFALGSLFSNHSGVERIRHIRQVDAHHNFTVVVSDFAQVGRYVQLDNWAFRAIKSVTPGPYTFILPATREVPRAMQHARRKTIGVRVPQHTTALALLDTLGEPLASSTLILPGHEEPMDDGWTISEELGHVLDAVLDSGDVGSEPTTVVDLTDSSPDVVRVGGGDPSPFEA
ncbi:L-threonylcarbamoyladenylate synthase [Brooklawnia cerclae]|uniref:tRNA threonylcarbamoyl adenosine modification protein (Sua5/YciO/YrdC/YwlC family) n=1 Tax=Brooklawnia cerclae TaxID=349934 RepID=A0ABX0SEN9_9ACTN|nr:L-threonylcarbamoyladenylate synthase [Brooklawnia cerclae]NIH56829.1 tRNA threonylcarbamoyl adenosine modification protein (Sua5/YciO/YrdC/YwlC family) [Brooklawnia cerclae]